MCLMLVWSNAPVPLTRFAGDATRCRWLNLHQYWHQVFEHKHAPISLFKRKRNSQLQLFSRAQREKKFANMFLLSFQIDEFLILTVSFFTLYKLWALEFRMYVKWPALRLLTVIVLCKLSTVCTKRPNPGSVLQLWHAEAYLSPLQQTLYGYKHPISFCNNCSNR